MRAVPARAIACARPSAGAGHRPARCPARRRCRVPGRRHVRRSSGPPSRIPGDRAARRIAPPPRSNRAAIGWSRCPARLSEYAMSRTSSGAPRTPARGRPVIGEAGDRIILMHERGRAPGGPADESHAPGLVAVGQRAEAIRPGRSSLSTSCSNAAPSTRGRSIGQATLRTARSASHPAISATAPACRTNQSGRHERAQQAGRLHASRDRHAADGIGAGRWPRLGGPDRVDRVGRAGGRRAAGRPAGTRAGARCRR